METILPTWLGSFYGSDFSYDDYERITINKFWQLTRGTSNAMKSRWFDYQRLHPLQATYYFFDCYLKIANQLSKNTLGKAMEIDTKTSPRAGKETRFGCCGISAICTDSFIHGSCTT